MITQASLIPDQRLRTMAQNLLAKTQAGQANWIRVNAPDLAYEIVLPESRIVMSYTNRRQEQNIVTLELRNAMGVSVVAWNATPPDTDNAVADPDWPLLYGLFVEVHRQVTGWDKVVGDIEKALAGAGAVGIPRATEKYLPLATKVARDA